MKGGIVVRKSKLMRQVEERFGEPLESLLPKMFNERGWAGTAVALGISKPSVGYWMLKLGIRVKMVVLEPGAYAEIDRSAAGSGQPEVVYAPE